MLNEWKEFQDYTGAVNYTARNKQDTTYLGRFTFDTILDFEGLNRVLTILARGFLFHNENGSPAEAPRETWQFSSDFRKLHLEFPGLVDENGSGWFHRHVHRVAAFVRKTRRGYPAVPRRSALRLRRALTRPGGTR